MCLIIYSYEEESLRMFPGKQGDPLIEYILRLSALGLCFNFVNLRSWLGRLKKSKVCKSIPQVVQEAWYNAKWFSSIQASWPEKTSKKWSDIARLSVKLNLLIFRNILGVFSALEARIKLISFAVYQAPQDTSLEYPHEVVWNILKINFFKDWPPLRDP